MIWSTDRITSCSRLPGGKFERARALFAPSCALSHTVLARRDSQPSLILPATGWHHFALQGSKRLAQENVASNNNVFLCLSTRAFADPSVRILANRVHWVLICLRHRAMDAGSTEDPSKMFGINSRQHLGVVGIVHTPRKKNKAGTFRVDWVKLERRSMLWRRLTGEASTSTMMP